MPNVVMIIEVDGQSPGVPGQSRLFPYSVVDPTPPLVTLKLNDNTGVIKYFWEFLDKPASSIAVFDDPTAAEPTFTPEAGLTSTYLIQCTVNDGESRGKIALAFGTERLDVRKLAAGEGPEFDSLKGWIEAYNDFVDKVDGFFGTYVDGYGKVYVNSNDSTAEFLEAKLEGSASIQITVLDNAGVKTLKLEAIGSVYTDEHVAVSSTDTTDGFLEDKMTAGAYLKPTVLNPSGNESLQFDVGDDGVVWVQKGVDEYENGTNLLAAWAAAASLTPNGLALSTTNRAKVKAPAGRYNLGASSLEVVANYVDLEGEGMARRISQGSLPIADPSDFICPQTWIVHEAPTSVIIATSGGIDDYRLSNLTLDSSVDCAGIQPFVTSTKTQMKDIAILCQFLNTTEWTSFFNGPANKGQYEHVHAIGMISAAVNDGDTWRNCTGGPASWAWGVGSFVGSGDDALLEDCCAVAGFASNGLVLPTGVVRRCVSSGVCFGALAFGGKAYDCRVLGAKGAPMGSSYLGGGIYQGYIENIYIEDLAGTFGHGFATPNIIGGLIQSSHEIPLIEVYMYPGAEPPKILNVHFKTPGTVPEIVEHFLVSSTPSNQAYINGCTTPGGIGPYVNNTVENPKNGGMPAMSSPVLELPLVSPAVSGLPDQEQQRARRLWEYLERAKLHHPFMSTKNLYNRVNVKVHQGYYDFGTSQRFNMPAIVDTLASWGITPLNNGDSMGITVGAGSEQTVTSDGKQRTKADLAILIMEQTTGIRAYVMYDSTGYPRLHISPDEDPIGGAPSSIQITTAGQIAAKAGLPTTLKSTTGPVRALSFDVNFVDMEGEGIPWRDDEEEAPTTQAKYHLTQTVLKYGFSDGGFSTFVTDAVDAKLKGLSFVSLAAGCYALRYNGNTSNLRLEDCAFQAFDPDGAGTNDEAFESYGQAFEGRMKNCYFLGRAITQTGVPTTGTIHIEDVHVMGKFFTGPDTTNVTSLLMRNVHVGEDGCLINNVIGANCIFEKCRVWGSVAFGGAAPFHGTLIECEALGTGVTAFGQFPNSSGTLLRCRADDLVSNIGCGLGAEIIDCDFTTALDQVVIGPQTHGAIVRNCRLTKPAGSAYAIDNGGGPPFAQMEISGCIIRGGVNPLGILNTLGNGYNVVI